MLRLLTSHSSHWHLNWTPRRCLVMPPPWRTSGCTLEIGEEMCGEDRVGKERGKEREGERGGEQREEERVG